MQVAPPSKAERKYLEHYLEPEAKQVDNLPGYFTNVVIIPAYGEGQNFFDTLASIPNTENVLVILVINERTDSPKWVQEKNQFLQKEIKKKFGNPIWQKLLFTLYRIEIDKQLLVVDCTCQKKPLPVGQGVGLARKIGCDIAFFLQSQGKIASPWLHCTDTDVLLPEDYFQQTSRFNTQKEFSALWYSFWHVHDPDPALAQAMSFYEISLRYYVLGLSFSRSPYAYQTLGSTMVIRASSYAEVRGIPKRNAAEDFYLFNKLSKVGFLQKLSGTPIQIQGRASSRVPFGTGKALEQISAKTHEGKDFYLYHPAVFSYLKSLLKLVPLIAEGNSLQVALGQYNDPLIKRDVLQKALEKINAVSSLEKTLQTVQNPKTRTRRFHSWFDGFRTLKFLHALRNDFFPSLPWKDALSHTPFLSSKIKENLLETETIRSKLFQIETEKCNMPTGI